MIFVVVIVAIVSTDCLRVSNEIDVVANCLVSNWRDFTSCNRSCQRSDWDSERQTQCLRRCNNTYTEREEGCPKWIGQ